MFYELTTFSERKYIVIHCTGYLKSWAKIGLDDTESETEDPCNLSCLVAVGRILPSITMPNPSMKYRPITFISRHAIDGKFVFVDQRYPNRIFFGQIIMAFFTVIIMLVTRSTRNHIYAYH